MKKIKALKVSARETATRRRDMRPETDKLVALLRVFLPRLGQRAALSIEPADDEGSWTVKVGETCEIEVGWDTHIETVLGKEPSRGYRVYTWKYHHGSRYQPPESEDVTEYEGNNPNKVLETVGLLYVAEAAYSAFMELANPEELA